jgi:protein-L-isoaspartate(D-aspartate) O-methyltransferase
MLDFKTARNRMVDLQLARRGIRDRRVLEAMRSVPRETFVAADLQPLAYKDRPLPIGESQTISQPYIVALMIEAAQLGPEDQALEIGAGSGYAAAVMSRIARCVYAIERRPALAKAAKQRFETLGYANIELRVGDGTTGWREAAPFDAILVAASGPQAPQALKNQLAVGGRMIIPIGKEGALQTLQKIIREDETGYAEQVLGLVKFVPLIGQQGWSEDGASSPRPRAAKPAIYTKPSAGCR